MFYAKKIGVINNSNNIVLYADKSSGKSGRYVILDKDKKDEFISKNKTKDIKVNVIDCLTTASSLGLGVLTYSQMKAGPVVKTLSSFCLILEGLVLSNSICKSYRNSLSAKIDKKCNVQNVDYISLKFNDDFIPDKTNS